MYKPFDGFVAKLTDNIKADTRYLPISEDDYAALLDHLPDDNDYTHLQISDGKAVEVVEARNMCGKIIISRSLEMTKPLAFRCGSDVSFILTQSGVEAIVCSMTDEDCKE